MKTMFALAAVLALAAPAVAENRSVLVVVTHDKDGTAAVAVHSDDAADRRAAAPVGEACKAVAGMKGWGSTVRVYVVTDRPLARKDRKALFDAIDANAWLDLSYYGGEAPKALADHFLKPAKRVEAPAAGGDDTPAAVEQAARRGAATAAADVKAGRPVILYYGKPWSADKALTDDATGLKVEIVGGCAVSKAFAAEVDAYNAAVRAWHAAKKAGK
jgi:hypothetical protein